MPGWYKKTKPMLYTFVIGMGAFNVIIPHFVLLELHQRITQIIFVHKSSLFYMNKANLELKLCCQLSATFFRLSPKLLEIVREKTSKMSNTGL